MSAVSTIPTSQYFFGAILQALSAHPNGLRRRDLVEAVADRMSLTTEQRRERLPSGATFRYRHRIGWGMNMLKSAGYIESAGAGSWRLSAAGQALLKEHPAGVDDDLRRRIFRESRIAADEGAAPAASEAATESTSAEQSPQERIEAAMQEVRAVVSEELRQQILQAPPEFFEELVLELLHAMGYGSSEDDLEHVGSSGDGGIDGVISLDRLGFEKVYVQAKRWQHSVGRPEVQAFFGALAGRKAKKGVLITTAGFTKEAREFGQHVSDTVVLIDGARLTALMIDHEVGVTARTIKLPHVDADYFADV